MDTWRCYVTLVDEKQKSSFTSRDKINFFFKCSDRSTQELGAQRDFSFIIFGSKLICGLR